MNRNKQASGGIMTRILRGVLPAAVAAAILGVSCISSTDRDVPNDDESRAIDFGIGKGQATRAESTTTADFDRMGVFGYSTPAAGWVPADESGYVPDYFVNTMVIKTSDGWKYSGVTRYWPTMGRKISFFAYAPYDDLGKLFTLHPSSITAKGAPTITYDVPAVPADQVDLLWNKQTDQDRNSNPGAKVVFTMDHALVRIDFEAQVDIDDKDRPFIVEVDDISVENVVGSGEFNLYTGAWTLPAITDVSDLVGYVLEPGCNGGLNNLAFHCQYDAVKTPDYTDPFSGYVSMRATNGYLMIIPQIFQDQNSGWPETQVVVNYNVTNILTGEVEAKTETIKLAENAAAIAEPWMAGVGITYQLTLSLTDGVAIKVKTGAFLAGDEWVDGPTDIIPVE